MNAESVNPPEEESANQTMPDAPSPRARTLREEILGGALALEEVAYILSLDRTTVAKYLREGTISGFQIGREWLIPEAELRRYVQRLSQGPRVPPTMAGLSEQVDAPTLRGMFERMRADLPLVGTRRKRPESTMGQAERFEGHAERFDKFTTRARHVLTLAQEEATNLNHHYIGTEHLLLGLLREGEGVAAKVLAGLGVELARVRSGVEFIIGQGDKPVAGEVGLTPRAKKVMELAVDEARQLGHHYIGTEHLLLGLVREGNGIAAGVLESLGVTLEKVRTETLRVLNQSPRYPGEASAAPPAPEEAANLVGAAEEARTCTACGARSPLYFRYCFNCGTALSG